MMTRYIVRFTVFVGVLLSAAVLVIQARPYDDSAIRELLPQNCDTSCFMGIQLGITTDAQALDLLKTNAWVDAESVRLVPQAQSSNKFDDADHIQWDWNANHPDLLATNPESPDANIAIRNHFVESIAFDSLIPVAAIYRLRGNPSVMVFAPVRNREPWSIEWIYTYTNTQLNIQMQVRACPYLANLWLQPLHIQMSQRAAIQDSTTSLTTPDIDPRAELKTRERLMCRSS